MESLAEHKWGAAWSSKRDDWCTPLSLFRTIDAEFGFTLDAAASANNALCRNYHTVEDNALLKPWPGTVWCNPPYSGKVDEWVSKGFNESRTNADLVVMLLFARTDTRWFHKYVYPFAEIRFIPGRVKFVGGKHSAPTPSMFVIWRKP